MDDKGDCLRAPVPDTPSPVPQLEEHAALSQHQFDVLLQQVQNLSTAVWNLQQNVAGHVALSPVQVHTQLPVSPLPPRSHTWEQEPDLAYDPPYASPYISRSPAGSSRYPGTPLYQAPAEDFLAQRVVEMGHELEALRMRSERPYELDFNAAPAFTLEIMEQLIPPRFKMPQTELYDGSFDPLDHLEAFKALMLLHGANDGTMCQAFLTILRKTTDECRDRQF